MRIGEYLQIGNKMKNARLKSGISQSAMAKKLGLSSSAYSNYENSYSEPQIETIEKFCNILKITISDLLQLKLPNESRAPIRHYSDLIYLLSELAKFGIEIDANCHKDTNTGRLVADFSFHNAQIAAIANTWMEIHDDLEKDIIDDEEYDMELDDLMKMFNVPIADYTNKKK